MEKTRRVKFGESIITNQFVEYDRKGVLDLYMILTDALVEAEESGLSNVFLTFSSTLEPYNDNTTGPVEIEVYGERPLNKKELAREAQEQKITDYAKEKGVTFYEASILMSLRERGKTLD